MSYPINYPTPQGANIQIFRESGSNSDWVKPQGASFVWFTLIGAGGGGGGGYVESASGITYYGGGGASGNVTNFMCPAFFIPDVLRVNIGKGGSGGTFATDVAPQNGGNGTNTTIQYQQKDGVGYQLLIASGGAGGQGTTGNGAGGAGQSADTGGPMTAAGFYNSIGGQTGAAGSNSAFTSGTTFVMGGSGFTENYGAAVTGYYGYLANISSGYSQISPIIMSIAGSKPDAASPFGCGGNGGTGVDGSTGIVVTNGSQGGDGLAIIVTW